MMRLNYNLLSEDLKEGVKALSQYGFLKTCDTGIALKAIPANRIEIEKNDESIEIIYDTKAHFYMALSRSFGMSNGTLRIQPKIEELGFMLDCSRNAVMRPTVVKELIGMLALAGYTYLELYTEDTYELPGEPYFGYKRGRYSQEEIMDIVAFADIFGISIIPCIQTLSHLSHLSSWMSYADFMQNNCTLRVGDERTYNLVRKCIRHCRDLFGTTRIHIGTDEASLGDAEYLEHIKRVFRICKEEGVRPDFWSDAFYHTKYSKEEMDKLFDGNQTPVYWEYYERDSGAYKKMIEHLEGYAGKISFAGCLHKHLGFAPDNQLSEKVTEAALAAVKECGVKDVLMTTWGDGGSECPTFAVMPSMWNAANKLYTPNVDVSQMIKTFTGYTYEEWMRLDAPNYMVPELDKFSNASKWAFYNDLLIGMMDYHIPDGADIYYEKLAKEFAFLAEKAAPYSYLFTFYAAFSNVMARKVTYSKRLYRAYQVKDMSALQSLKEELPDIRSALEDFLEILRSVWMKHHKGFGFEVMDLRIGGMIARCNTVAQVLEDYLNGTIVRIYELEEERIAYWEGVLQGEEIYAPWFFSWSKSFTENDIL